MFNYKTYLQLRTMQAHMQAIMVSALPWDAKYRQVFSDACARRIHALLAQMDESLDWYDPDADYEDDVRAFATAFDDKLTDLQKQLAALDIVQAYEAFAIVTPLDHDDH